MRIAVVTASPGEMWNFNVAVWDTLRAILRLTQIPQQQSGLGHRVKIAFKRHTDREHPERREYLGKATFHPLLPDTQSEIDQAANKPMTLSPPFLVKEISFWLPEGFNVEDCFNWLASEIALQAYVMTQGKVFQVGTIAGGLEKEKNGTFILEFDTGVDYFDS